MRLHPVIKAGLIMTSIVLAETAAMFLYKVLRKTGCTLDI